MRATGVVGADARLFGAVSNAILQGREVGFTYRKLTGDAPERRRMRPYHLGQVDHGWYLFGFDLDRGAVRTFALPRIADLEVTTTPFDQYRCRPRFRGSLFCSSLQCRHLNHVGTLIGEVLHRPVRLPALPTRKSIPSALRPTPNHAT